MRVVVPCFVYVCRCIAKDELDPREIERRCFALQVGSEVDDVGRARSARSRREAGILIRGMLANPWQGFGYCLTLGLRVATVLADNVLRLENDDSK